RALLDRFRPPPPPVATGTDEQAARKYLDAAEALTRDQRFEPALDMLRRAAALPITDPDLNIRLTSLRDTVETGALVRQASNHLVKEDWRAAAETAKQALDRDPRNREALAILENARVAERPR